MAAKSRDEIILSRNNNVHHTSCSCGDSRVEEHDVRVLDSLGQLTIVQLHAERFTQLENMVQEEHQPRVRQWRHWSG
jgi:hypothetical protein